MLGDTCQKCGQPATVCSGTCEEKSPCLPANDKGECPDWVPMKCVFWTEDPIPGTPIKKGTRMTEVVTYLINRIKELESRVADLEGS